MVTRKNSLVVAALLLATLPSPGWAQPDDPRAEELNDSGKRLFADGKFEDALVKFRQATVIAPRGKYYFNVCFTLSQLKRYSEAVTACEAVDPNGADAKLVEKTQQLLTNLRAQVSAEGGGDTGTGAGDGAGDGTVGADGTGTVEGAGPSATGPAPAPPPPMAVGQSGAPIHHDYIWSLGFELYGVNNLSVGGSLPSGDRRFSNGGFQFRATGTMTLDKRRRLGAQGYVGYSVLPDDAIADSISSTPLSLVDLGVAGLWHIPLSRRMYLTPLAGGHLSFQGPSDSPEVFIAVGGRLGLSLDWVLGREGRHVLTLSSAANLYSRAGGESNGFTPAEFGLDSGGVTTVFGVGYTLRFQTPIGQLPVFTLE